MNFKKQFRERRSGIIIVVLLLNLALALYNFIHTRSNASQRHDPALKAELNTPAPDFEWTTTKGEKSRISDINEPYIILRFSDFYYDDLPYLLYLEYFCGKNADDVKLILVNIKGNSTTDSIHNYVTISAPIINDDGTIKNIFGANAYDTLIIHNNKIIQKYFRSEANYLYKQLAGKIKVDSHKVRIDNNYYCNYLLNLRVLDPLTNERFYIKDLIRNNKLIINMNISCCLTCQEGERVRLVKTISDACEKDDVLILQLYSAANKPVMINEYVDKHEIKNANIRVGIIEADEILNNNYYNIFKIDIDPRIIIIDSNKTVLFLEDGENSGPMIINNIREILS